MSLDFDRKTDENNDHNNSNGNIGNGDTGYEEEEFSKHMMPGGLPDDLPKSLDDRRSVPVLPQETEMYDAWQG